MFGYILRVPDTDLTDMDKWWRQIPHSRVDLSGTNHLVFAANAQCWEFSRCRGTSNDDVNLISQAGPRRLWRLRTLSSFCPLRSCAFPFGNYPCNDVRHVWQSSHKEARKACRRNRHITLGIRPTVSPNTVSGQRTKTYLKSISDFILLQFR